MSFEQDIEDIVHDVVTQQYGLPRRGNWGSPEICETCGCGNEPNKDYLGKPNGYRGHSFGTCIDNLRGRIERLEQRNDQDVGDTAAP